MFFFQAQILRLRKKLFGQKDFKKKFLTAEKSRGHLPLSAPCHNATAHQLILELKHDQSADSEKKIFWWTEAVMSK